MTNKQKCYHYPKEKFSFVFVAVSHTTFFIKIIPFPQPPHESFCEVHSNLPSNILTTTTLTLFYLNKQILNFYKFNRLAS
jgi:hypothetical protein